MSQLSTINLSQFNQAIDAIITGDISTLTQLLSQNLALVHQRSTADHHAQLIHYATANGVEDDKQRTPANIVEIAQLLFESGANPHAIFNAYGQTSALIALITSAHPAQAGKLYDLVTLFCEYGNPNGGNNDSLPLATALDFHSVDSIRALLDFGASVENAVFSAIAGNLQKLQLFIQSGRQTYTNSLGTVMDDQHAILGYALAASSLMGHRDVVEYLLTSTDIDAQVTVTESTALHEAVIGNHSELVIRLLEWGADNTRPDKLGFTPLHRAVWNGQLDMIDILLQYDAPLEVKNSYGGTVIDTAVYCYTQTMYPPQNQEIILKKLLSAGADANQVSPFPTGNTMIDNLLTPHRS